MKNINSVLFGLILAIINMVICDNNLSCSIMLNKIMACDQNIKNENDFNME